ncbi:NAD/NADP-dependent octopine/nopaline dehydrogenase family protein [Arthrobacter sp. StoSoilB5]|uniref:NAD/NADP-dependent octopine/nopaline dehydrogenase family protein n=1 Tax=Arthrobacter sp. StoSoilB5 TaxID=2830992 RepID=UPI001CC43A8F|nr:NAD/NADP-dependent octopine/nopaline dehydrogenase family protein [Arthrobacter sp. StoSoilB5]BCW45122.1 hypothetical protein StoSoilB5_23060 [Arthrobacter sp. StoSoilB5]
MARTTVATVAVIGAGSSGQAIAGFLGLGGYHVNLWNRDDDGEVNQWLKPIIERGGISVQGTIEGFAPVRYITTEMADAISGADVILVNTTADAYPDIALQLAPHLLSSQILILMCPGTLGSIGMWHSLVAAGYKDDLMLGETSTTVFGSHVIGPASVHIGAMKDRVEIASLPSGQADVMAGLLPEFPFVAVEDVLISGLSNVGPALHIVPMLLNAGRIEHPGSDFLYYAEGVTPGIASVVGQLDDERVAVARAFGYEPTSLSEYLTQVAGAPQGSLYESIRGCAMYSGIRAPDSLNHRFLWEDTLSGAVPLLALAEIADVPVPICDAFVALASATLGRDFRATGRSARNLALEGLTVNSMKELVNDHASFLTWTKSVSSKLPILRA